MTQNAAHPFRTPAVLIVEDDPTFRAMLAAAVAAAGDMRLVGVAADLPEGLRLLDQQAPDVLLVDIGLPSGSGIDLIRYAKQRLPQCESMVVTVFADDQWVVECIAAGATGYLLKGSRDVDIVQQIRLLLEGGSPISPAIARRLLMQMNHKPDGAAPALPTAMTLSEQEQRVLSLCAKGYNYKEIAPLMGLAHSTVETYVKRIYQKLQVHSKTQALHEARKSGLALE